MKLGRDFVVLYTVCRFETQFKRAATSVMISPIVSEP